MRGVLRYGLGQETGSAGHVIIRVSMPLWAVWDSRELVVVTGFVPAAAGAHVLLCL